MAALRMRLRAEMRSRWRATFALALLIAAAGGGILAGAAGSRRTASAFERLLRETRAADVLVNPDLGTESSVTIKEIAGLPQVADAAYIDGMGLLAALPDGSPDFEPEHSIIPLAAVDGKAGYTVERPKILRGRMPDRAREFEAFVNPAFVRQIGKDVGDRVTLLAADFSLAESGTELPPLEPVTFDIVGVGVFQSEIVIDEGFVNPSMQLTPVFHQRHPMTRAGYWGALVRLEHGASDLAPFREAVDALAGPDEAIEYQTSVATATKVRDAVRPQSLALALFAAALAASAILLIGQGLGRQVFVESQEHPALHALGFTRKDLFLLSMARPALAVAAGVVGAVVVAIAASPLMPIGPARLAEPHPGVSIDATVLGLGSLGLIVGLLGLAALPARRASRRHEETTAVRTSAIAESLRSLSFGPSAITGVRFALEPGSGRSSLPVRTTLGATAIAVASVAAALTFAAGLDHLVKTPRLFGWDWDIAVASDLQPEQEAKLLNDDADVAVWSRMEVSRLNLDGNNVLAVGVSHSGSGYVHPTIADGREPRAGDEIALGGRTLRRLGVSVGDRVEASRDDAHASLRVVGRAVFPGLGTYPGADKTGPGDGAVVWLETLHELGPRIGQSQNLVRLRPGVDAAAAQARLKKQLSQVSEEFAEAARVRHPAEIVNYGRVRTTPILLAAFLALLAIGSVAHALGTAVRRRRRDLALLKTFGFVRRQVRSTIAWQATTVAAVAVVLGVPIGIALGRWSWATLAGQLGAVVAPRTPAMAVAAVSLATVLISNAIAAFPARSAARTRPALVLRTE
jgi:putative ABC transport system permease protein